MRDRFLPAVLGLLDLQLGGVAFDLPQLLANEDRKFLILLDRVPFMHQDLLKYIRPRRGEVDDPAFRLEPTASGNPAPALSPRPALPPALPPPLPPHDKH